MSSPARQRIAMTNAELANFLHSQAYCVVGAQGTRGWPPMVTPRDAIIDDHMMLQAFGKSQKIVKLRRDRRISCLGEAPGASYGSWAAF